MPSDLAFDVLIVGAGPAGMAAAVAASARAESVAVVDDNPGPGGQIWRDGERKPPSLEAATWFNRLRAARVETLDATQVLGPLGPGLLLAETEGRAIELRYGRLVVATGARELFLPFPGWTLPNVMGAGGLQAMVKSGLSIAGKRVVVAGSGPLLLAVAAYLAKRGSRVRLVAEQAPLSSIARFGLGLWREPKKLAQALALRASMGRVPFRAGCWPVVAEGDGVLESVTLTDGSNSWREPCDYLACGFGLVPNVELPATLGCTLHKGFVGVDALQRTTVPDVFAAGEVTGIGGLDRSLVEGEIAGLAAGGDEAGARFLFPGATGPGDSPVGSNGPSPSATSCGIWPRPRRSSAVARTSGTAYSPAAPPGPRRSSRPDAGWARARAGSVEPRRRSCTAGPGPRSGRRSSRPRSDISPDDEPATESTTATARSASSWKGPLGSGDRRCAS